jgi:hypothetical protein
VTQFVNPIPSNYQTLVVGDNGPFGNYRYFTVPPNDAGESAGPFVLRNLLNSNASIPITAAATAWQVYGEMSVRSGLRAEYFSSPELADVPGSANAAIMVPAGPPPVDLGNTFVMQPGFLDGNILFQGPNLPTPAQSCVKDILRATDNQPQPPTSVPSDYSLGGESFVDAVGQNTKAPGAQWTALSGWARANFDAVFDPVGARFIGPTIEPSAFDLALGILNPDTQAIWSYGGVQLVFQDPQRRTQIAGDPDTYQNSQIDIGDNSVPPLTITAGVHTVHDVAYCFGRLTINYENVGASGSGQFIDPSFSIQAGSFAGTDFQGNLANFNVGGQAYGTPASLLGEGFAKTGEVVACLPHATYDFAPVVTAQNTGPGTSSTALPVLSGITVPCEGDVSITPPLVVTGTAPTCVSSSTVPVSAIVSSSDLGQPQIPIDTVTVSVSQVQADAGADAGVTVTNFGSLCGGVDAGAAGSCGGGSPGACGCTSSPALTGTVTVGACRSSVTFTAQSTEGGATKTSTDTHSVFYDPTAPALACSNITAALPPGQSTVPVGYSIGVSDACPQDVVVTCTTPSGGSFGAGSTTVSCTATNGCEQTSCSFQVNVAASCPVLTCPANATVPLSANACQASPTYAAVLTDSCAGTPPSSVTNTFSFSAPGSQSFVYQADVQSCTQTVTAVDTTPPAIATKPIAPVEVCGGAATSITLPIPQACDACSTEPPSGSCDNPVPVKGTIVSQDGLTISIAVPASGKVSLTPGTYVVSWTATDPSGNATTVTQSFTIAGPPAPAPWSAKTSYASGALVSFGGYVLEARQPNTGVQPTLPGSATPDATLAIWEIPTPCGITPWLDETHYQVGSMVTFGGITYVCIADNVAVFNWTPAVVAALWRPARNGDQPICPCP